MLGIKKLFAILVCVLTFISPIVAQTNIPEKERYILLWDVSGSLLSHDGNGPSEDEYTKQSITSSKSGNGLWMPLKEALISSIELIEENGQSEIIVIPFYAKPLDVFRKYADKNGKKEIIDTIKNYKYPRDKDVEKRTDLINALKKFEELVKDNTSEYVNYMFFYTDGGHETVKDRSKEKDALVVKDQINNFNGYVTEKGRYIYRFYYLVHSDADKFGVFRDYEYSDKNHFWVVDSLVNVKFIGLSTTVTRLNICDSSEIKINLTKDCKDFKGKITFKANGNDFYNVNCVTKENSFLEIKVTPKPDVSIPEKETIKLCGKLEKNENDKEQKYFFLLDSQLEIVCNYKPEEVLVGLDTSEIEYNLCDNYKDGTKKDSVKTIPLLEGSKKFSGVIKFEPIENDLYDVCCKTSEDKSQLEVVVTPKKDISYGNETTIDIKCELNENNEDFRKRFKLKNEKITIKCNNLPKRTIDFCLQNENGLKSGAKKTLDLGTTNYYPECFGKSDSLACLKFSLLTSFDEAAKSNNASCRLSFCDDNGNSLSYSDFKIVVNGKDTFTDSCVLDSKCEKVDFEIVPSKSAKNFTFKGYIIISDVKNADEVNGCKTTEPVKILPWRFEHDRIPNPLAKALKRLFLLLILAVFLLKLIKWLKRKFSPSFPNNKIMVFENENNEYLFDAPKLTRDVILEGNNSPLIVKGYSNIYIAHSKQKKGYFKQLILNKDVRDWTSRKNFWGGWTYMIGTNLPFKIRQITISPQDNDSLKLNIFYVDRPKEKMTLNYDQIGNFNIPNTGISIHFTNGVINNINN